MKNVKYISELEFIAFVNIQYSISNKHVELNMLIYFRSTCFRQHVGCVMFLNHNPVRKNVCLNSHMGIELFYAIPSHPGSVVYYLRLFVKHLCGFHFIDVVL